MASSPVLCVCVCVCACVRACVRVCVCEIFELTIFHRLTGLTRGKGEVNEQVTNLPGEGSL